MFYLRQVNSVVVIVFHLRQVNSVLVTFHLGQVNSIVVIAEGGGFCPRVIMSGVISVYW